MGSRRALIRQVTQRHNQVQAQRFDGGGGGKVRGEVFSFNGAKAHGMTSQQEQRRDGKLDVQVFCLFNLLRRTCNQTAPLPSRRLQKIVFLVLALTLLWINLVQKQVHHNVDSSPSTSQSRTDFYSKKSVMQHKSDASSRKVPTGAKGVHEDMTSPVLAPDARSNPLRGRRLPSKDGDGSLQARFGAPPPNPAKALLHIDADDALDGHAAKASEVQQRAGLQPLTPRVVDGPATTTRTRSVM